MEQHWSSTRCLAGDDKLIPILLSFDVKRAEPSKSVSCPLHFPACIPTASSSVTSCSPWLSDLSLSLCPPLLILLHSWNSCLSLPASVTPCLPESLNSKISPSLAPSCVLCSPYPSILLSYTSFLPWSWWSSSSSVTYSIFHPPLFFLSASVPTLLYISSWCSSSSSCYLFILQRSLPSSFCVLSVSTLFPSLSIHLAFACRNFTLIIVYMESASSSLLCWLLCASCTVHSDIGRTPSLLL